MTKPTETITETIANTTETDKARCAAFTAEGKPCNNYPLEGGEFCFFHSPEHAHERSAAQRRGGEHSPYEQTETPFPDADITNARGLRILVTQLIKETWTLRPSIERARTLAMLVNVQKDIIDRSKYEQKIIDDKAEREKWERERAAARQAQEGNKRAPT